jgi:hypothetical protein
MGNRRIGRKRLKALSSRGVTDTITAGASSATVTRQTTMRIGNKIITEISVDLASNTNASNTSADTIIGKSGATENCFIAEISQSIHGLITYAELACLEVPGTGVVDINVVLGSASDDNQAAAVSGTVTLIDSNADLTKGSRVGAAVTEVDYDSETKKYLYLTSGKSGTTGTYTTGKLLITLEGIATDAVPDA